jgi:hypothetical protein
MDGQIKDIMMSRKRRRSDGTTSTVCATITTRRNFKKNASKFAQKLIIKLFYLITITRVLSLYIYICFIRSKIEIEYNLTSISEFSLPN